MNIFITFLCQKKKYIIYKIQDSAAHLSSSRSYFQFFSFIGNKPPPALLNLPKPLNSFFFFFFFFRRYSLIQFQNQNQNQEKKQKLKIHFEENIGKKKENEGRRNREAEGSSEGLCQQAFVLVGDIFRR